MIAPLAPRFAFRLLSKLCLALAVSPILGAAVPEHTVLTTAAEVRALAAEAARGVPVRLQGIYMGEADPKGIAFVIQDGTDGIYVQGPAALVSELARGDLLEIEGMTDPGGFAPYVVAQAIRHTGHGEIPEPLRVTLDELNAGQMDAKWVEISGIVRSVEPKAPTDTGPPPPGTRYKAPSQGPSVPGSRTVKMKLAAGSARVTVEVEGDFPPEEYVDAEVRLRGLCFNLHNHNRQFVRPFVQVPRGVCPVIERPPPEKPFGGQPRPVASLLRFDQLTGKHGHRVHVRGTVVHHEPGAMLWVRDGDRSLRVETAQRGTLQPGDEVDVVGFPARRGYSAELEDAAFRKLSSGQPLFPRTLTDVSSALRNDADLVQLEARLVEVRRFAESVALTLEWKQTAIRAEMKLSGDGSRLADWLPGSVVRVAGVCAVKTDEAGPLGGLWEPRSFELRLRSPVDLAVLQQPPWWNVERAVWILSAFLALAVGWVAIVMLAARRRLKDQEHRRAMAETEFTAILSERNRVAREIHDTLSQNLGAISIQLELARTHAAGISAPALNHIASAHQLARAALADARESIWNMRSHILEHCDLPEALDGVLKRMTDGTGVTPSLALEGVSRRLPPVVENNLLRIGQEAITNACKYAKPTRIDVTIAFEGRRVRITVVDDGIGFATPAPPSQDRRSFGLVGIRERAELLGGKAEIKSAPGQGTRVSVVVSV
ncbi:MAG: sensor histidine kinase [Opitutaceae bacterium]